MTVVTVRPDGVVSHNNMNSAYASDVNDNSDSTLSITISSLGYVRYTLGNPTIPAGGTIKSVAIRTRSSRYGSASPGRNMETKLFDHNGTLVASATTVIDWTSPTTTTGCTLTNASSYSAANLNSFEAQWQYIAPYDGYQIAVYEVYADITYVAKPVLAVTNSGTITNTRAPLIQWNNTLDSDGGGQTRYEVRIFNSAQYGIGGFDPATSPAIYSSGAQPLSSQFYQSGVLFDGTHRAYVRVAQTVNGNYVYSDWTYGQFTIAYVEPPIEDQRTYSPQVVGPTYRRPVSAPLKLDFTWTPNAAFPTYQVYGKNYPPTTQLDGVSRTTDANYASLITQSGISVDFVAVLTVPAGLYIREYKWDFGDGNVGYGPTTKHLYRLSSTETAVNLMVTDSTGNTWNRTKTLKLTYLETVIARVYEVRN